MDLFQKLLECKDEEVDLIIDKVINECNNQAPPTEQLGFTDNMNSNSVHKGFIPLKTRIKYANFSVEDYGMETTDFIYEYAHFIKSMTLIIKQD